MTPHQAFVEAMRDLRLVWHEHDPGCGACASIRLACKAFADAECRLNARCFHGFDAMPEHATCVADILREVGCE